ncbi:MAG: TIGR01620 family protein [Pseudomonadota bacterium]
MTAKKGAVLIDLEGEAASPEAPARDTPASAPPVPDLPGAAPRGQALQTVAQLAARPPSRLLRMFLSALLALVLFMASVAATNFVTGLLASSPILGAVAAGLFGLVCLTALMIAGREWLGYRRLARLDGIRAAADAALAAGTLTEAKSVATRISTLYGDRPELRGARQDLEHSVKDQFEVGAVYELVESHLLEPLDTRAEAEIAAAARQVATVTALVPLALADVIAALTANLRMIRRIAEIYGGRAGTLGSWRLTRSVLTHLVATGAVAVGDDLIGSVAGGSVLSKISRRFGEGVVNGALTARVGVAALEVCRPLPFGETRKPSVTGLVKQALGGLFSSAT